MKWFMFWTGKIENLMLATIWNSLKYCLTRSSTRKRH